MESAEGTNYTYVIDVADRVVSVGESWLEFARENDAPELTRERVLGSSLWDFVAGSETRVLYERLFASLRQDGRPRSIPFRCDSPMLYRFMELRLAPSERSGIQLSGVLLREQVRVYIPLLDRALKKAMYSFPFCSVCNRVFAFGFWLETDEAIRRLHAFETSKPPALDPTFCDPCRSALKQAAGPAAS